MASLDRRNFFTVMVPVDEGSQTLRKVYRFQCRCGAVHVVSANGFTGRRNREDLMRVMKRGGWVLGNNAAHDLCPDCSCSSRSARAIDQRETWTDYGVPSPWRSEPRP